MCYITLLQERKQFFPYSHPRKNTTPGLLFIHSVQGSSSCNYDAADVATTRWTSEIHSSLQGD